MGPSAQTGRQWRQCLLVVWNRAPWYDGLSVARFVARLLSSIPSSPHSHATALISVNVNIPPLSPSLFPRPPFCPASALLPLLSPRHRPPGRALEPPPTITRRPFLGFAAASTLTRHSDRGCRRGCTGPPFPPPWCAAGGRARVSSWTLPPRRPATCLPRCHAPHPAGLSPGSTFERRPLLLLNPPAPYPPTSNHPNPFGPPPHAPPSLIRYRACCYPTPAVRRVFLAD
ncbi:hypothetical protein C8Q77DRAFT_218362 [Trametes polyzona]|nr:hypothetical protein C8Q77DRAFT_218362 [Trametes polyzona]